MIKRRSFLFAARGILAAAIGQEVLSTNVSAFERRKAVLGLSASSIRSLRSRLSGLLILPDDLRYQPSRLLYSSRFNPSPIAIVRPVNESDVQHTIEFARANGIGLALRSGGHSYLGASGGDGIILDMSSMAGISHISGAAYRIGSGAKLQQIYDRLRCQYGLTIPSGSCGSVGFAGIAQGGGFGYLQRKYGLTCDRVRSARIVLADSSIVSASLEGDSQLYWAIRGGGGGSFGVVTTFDVEAVRCQNMQIIGWNWPLSAADEVLLHFYSLSRSGRLPRHTTAALIFNVPSASNNIPQCACTLFTTGSEEEARISQQLFIGKKGIPPIPDSVYLTRVNPPACDNHPDLVHETILAKSSMVYGSPAADTGSKISEWILERNFDPLLSSSGYASVNILSFGGAVADLSPEATAFRHRQAKLEVQYLVTGISANSQTLLANQMWLRDVYASVAPRLSNGGSGGYLNYPDEDLACDEYPQHYWGDNYPRLQMIKRRVDPSNFFQGKQTVRP